MYIYLCYYCLGFVSLTAIRNSSSCIWLFLDVVHALLIYYQKVQVGNLNHALLTYYQKGQVAKCKPCVYLC